MVNQVEQVRAYLERLKAEFEQGVRLCSAVPPAQMDEVKQTLDRILQEKQQAEAWLRSKGAL